MKIPTPITSLRLEPLSGPVCTNMACRKPVDPAYDGEYCSDECARADLARFCDGCGWEHRHCTCKEERSRT